MLNRPILQAALLAGALIALGLQARPVAAPGAEQAASGGNVERLADALFSDYLLPFEAASLLLLGTGLAGLRVRRRRRSA